MGLVDPSGRPIGSGTAAGELEQLEPRALLEGVTSELRLVLAANQEFAFQLSALQALQVAGVLQLALRHPTIRATSGAAADTIEELLQAVREFFSSQECPHVLEVIRRGDDPEAGDPTLEEIDT